MRKLYFMSCMLLLSFCLHAQNTTRLGSPDIQPDNSVIFRIKAPGAYSVQVVGTFSPKFIPTPMEKKDSGLFEVKIGPLASNMYEYRFILDSTLILDPINNAVTRDGSFVENRLLIPGKLGDLTAVQNVPHGNVTAVWYPSPTLGAERRMYVYTPPGYDKTNDKYPVLYLLHGAGGDEDGWINRGRANYIIDNLIAADKAAPMIVVVTNGDPDNVAAPLDRPLNTSTKKDASGIDGMASHKFEGSLIKDVIPYIETNYRVITDADHRAIAGFSMGGYQTQNITNAYPTMFKYIGVMSMGLFSSFGNFDTSYNKGKHIAQLKALMAAKPKLYWIGIGKDDFLYGTVTKLKSLYDEIGFKYTYYESEGNHTWGVWRLYLTKIVPNLFR